MITYEIPRQCYRCLCRACGQIGCPHRDYKYKRCQVCWSDHSFRPILDCENFYFKFFHKYRIRRIYKIPKVRYVDKTNSDDIRVMLTEILSLLQNGSKTSPTTDVNCIRQECLCLSCEYFASCKDRCDMCKNYKGQYPVRLCAKKLDLDRYK